MRRIIGWSAVLGIGLPVLVGTFIPSATAAVSPLWWDPASVHGPSDYELGWNLRVPLQVTNPYSYALTTSHPLLAHLDANQLAAKAGWLQTQVAGLPYARSFTFDFNSTRLVEYAANWNSIRGPVPFSGFRGWFDPDQSAVFGREQSQPYDDASNPILTLLWYPTTPIPAGQSRYYYVYFDVQENSIKPPADLDSIEAERLAGAFWIGRGTELYGYARGSAASNLVVTAAETDGPTVVRVLEYRAGLSEPRPRAPDSNLPQNPFTLDAQNNQRSFRLSLSDSAFKIEATKPVLVENMGHPLDLRSDFVPSLDGGPVGTKFRFQARTDTLLLMTDTGREQDVLVQTMIDAASTLVRIPAGAGYAQVNVPSTAALVTLDSDAPIAVQPRPDDSHGTIQAPDVRSGGPMGRWFLAATSDANAYGMFSPTESSHPALLDLPDFNPMHPAGLLRPGWGQDKMMVPDFMSGNGPPSCQNQAQTRTFKCPIVALSTTDDVPLPEQGRFLLAVDGRRLLTAPTQFTTAIGGDSAMRFVAPGGVLVAGLFNGTRVDVRAPAPAQTVYLEKDSIRVLPTPNDDPTVAYELTSDKPIVVVPLLNPPPGVGQVHYVRFSPGRLPAPPVQLGTPEFRGYLVRLASPDGVDPLFVSGQPGEALDVAVEVQNAGRWNGGIALDDTVETRAIAPANWQGRLVWQEEPNQDVVDSPLPSGGSRLLHLRIHPPADQPAGVPVDVRIEASSKGNPNMRDRLHVIVLVEKQFGVRMWWDVGGGTTVKDIVRSLDVDATRTFGLLLENTGSSPDTFDLRVNEAALGWNVRLIDPRNPARLATRVVELAPGEPYPLQVTVRAPPGAEHQVASTFLLQASSSRSAGATDLLQAVFRLNLAQGIELQTGETRREILPGGVAHFPFQVSNVGKEAAAVRLELPAPLPTGWNATLVGLGQQAAQLDVTLLPEQRVNLTVQLRAAPSSRFGERVPFVVQASLAGGTSSNRQVLPFSAAVLRLANFTLTKVPELEATPGARLPLNLTLLHGGNSPGNFQLYPHQLPVGWRVDTASPVSLPAPEAGKPAQGSLTTNLTVAPHAPAGKYQLFFRVTQVAAGTRNLTLNVTIQPFLSHLLVPPIEPVPAGPGEPALALVRVENRGNFEKEIAFSVEGPQDWRASVSPPNATLSPGRNTTVTVALEAPYSAPSGLHTFRLRGSTPDVPDETATLSVAYGLPALRIVEVLPPAAKARVVGDVLFLTVLIANDGTAPARSLPVALVRGDQRLDEVLLERLEPNRTAIVTLQLVWAGADDTYAVEIDPDRSIPEVEAADNRLTLSERELSDPVSGLPVPGSLAILALVLTPILVRRSRRP